MGDGSVQPSAISSTKKGTFARVPALTICTRRMGRPFGLSALVGIVTLYQVLAATLPDETKYGFSATLVGGVWNCFGTDSLPASGGGNTQWYEIDPIAGISLGLGKYATLDVTYTGQSKSPWGTRNIGFEANTVINRKDWGLSWNVALETGGVLVGEDITVNIELELIEQA